MRHRLCGHGLMDSQMRSGWRTALLMFAWLCVASPVHAQQRPQLAGNWKSNANAKVSFTIRGIGSRDNPLRRQLKTPFDGDELFIRYRLKYRTADLDAPPDGNGEFLVLWLDEIEGNDLATHSNSVPNIGLHLKDEANRFMVRFQSSQQSFGPKLIGDREYLIVSRLWKSKTGKASPFDRIDMWIDPKLDGLKKPQATASTKKGVKTIRWMGFSTGVKTELDDQITVRDISLAKSWNEILGVSAEPTIPVE